MRSGRAVSSTSPPVRYLELPCDFFCFFFRLRLANGSILSTKVPEEDMVGVRGVVSLEVGVEEEEDLHWRF